jgi:hypothetical protein
MDLQKNYMEESQKSAVFKRWSKAIQTKLIQEIMGSLIEWWVNMESSFQMLAQIPDGG